MANKIGAKKLIASCGMNCGICKFYLREKDGCPGCHVQPKETCLKCRIRICEKHTGDFCYDCKEFPCQRLKNLDKRYRSKYNMSEIENLHFIRENGMEKFLEKENKKWACSKCGGVISCHTQECSQCGVKNAKIKDKNV
ncbi:TPA: hypothetical protein DD449_01170 [Candidatus Berkelbacteria bacterium]|uniref:DUF3795 domain-containing protein n=1 Tax=Berkelbacteria bacterium GW2011_GWE1_39_12 TaxID=1618337 RepID=A0A0G4B4U7_9BACT|nr:MAG: hypothetical protein UT28_C0001G0853 [Berkelbacteria bacterium GW2011_GWE1_39_12]HBO60283.1 hypothetical protein [Candidatus Berkelbacteria bacterium]